MAGHTPGPWRVTGGGRAIEAGDFYVASAVGGVASQGRNAHLISAAPDLLRIAELVVEGGTNPVVLLLDAKAALAKARGPEEVRSK